MLRRRSVQFIGVVAALAMLASSTSGAQAPATASETVLWKPTFFASDPVRVTRVLYNGQPIESMVPFQGNTEWVKGLSVEIENISHKTLTYISFQVRFTTLRNLGIQYVSEGQFPEHRRLAQDGSGTIDPDPNQPISVAPGDRIIVPFGPAFPRIQSYLAKRSPIKDMSDAHYCDIVPTLAYFPDGTMWQIGQFFKETHENKNTYDRITPEEFYGNAGGPSK